MFEHLPSSVQSFVEHEAARAQRLGVKIVFVDEPTAPYLDTDMQVGGYFSATPPTLAVAMGKPWQEWLPIFVHEGCHMDQWHENCVAWVNNTLPNGVEAVEQLDAWCQGNIELSEEELQDVLRRAQDVEMDCERRVLEKIDLFSLPIDKEEYAQKANAYVHFYAHMLKTKKWYPPRRAPYELAQVWGRAPKVLTRDMPAMLEEAFRRAYPTTCSPCQETPRMKA